MKTLFKVLAIASAAGAALASVPASAEFSNGELVRVIVYPDGTTVY
jgi:hypothetical protein